MSEEPTGSTPASSSEEKTELLRLREEKLAKIAALGLQPYPNKFAFTHTIRDLVAAYGGKNAEELEKEPVRVSVPGRIMLIRDMGKACFFTFSDGTERLQAYVRKDSVGEADFKMLKLLDLGDHVGTTGTMFRTRTGELTVKTDSLHFLAKALLPLPEKFHGLTDLELRHRQRYLDLAVNPETKRIFETRGAVVRGMRRFLDARGYLEVETPMLHPIPGGALARPFRTHHNTLDMDLYLRIAPELYLKRLVVGGLDRVYELNRVFRNEGISHQHNPEFTMLEFYEAYSNYEDLMAMTEQMITGIARDVVGKTEIMYGQELIPLDTPWPRLPYMESLVSFSGLDSAALADEKHVLDEALRWGMSGPKTHGKALDYLFDRYVKPKLQRPTFITDHPTSISPLSKQHPDRPEFVQRFELWIGGMEVANGFSELNDPVEQLRRFEEQGTDRKAGDEEAHLIDHDYIRALRYGLPPTAGEGIGVDRLTMLLTSSPNIREVILFPLLRPEAK
ncbi:MAG: lysine--tRNA ligase [Acidobacteria bacterium]|nr:lysine--tRNA ligase [Acidobacteriota bacterium]